MHTSSDNGQATVVIISDSHINSTVGLCPPLVNLDDGGTYTANKVQRWLYDVYRDICENVKNTTGKKIAIINGDLAELDTKRRTVQLITANKAIIMSLVIMTLEPLLEVVDRAVFIRGTQAHVGKGAWIEEAVARDCAIAIKNGDESASWYHFRANISGVRLDVAHHASMGEIAANSASKLARRCLEYYYGIGQPLPHFIVRSHNHRYADSGGNYPVMAVMTPALCSITEFGYRQGHELQPASVGAVMIKIDNGRGTLEKMVYTRNQRNVWSLRI